jgi:hypothetical protein
MAGAAHGKAEGVVEGEAGRPARQRAAARGGGQRLLAVEGGYSSGVRWRAAAVEGSTKTSERRRESVGV